MGSRSPVSIDDSLCQGCAQCVEVCPQQLFVQRYAGKTPRIRHPRDCTGCGHCVSICPTGAVQHADFPEYRVPKS